MCLGQVLLPNELQKEFWFLDLLVLGIRSEGLWTTVSNYTHILYLLCSRKCFECLMYINFFNPHNSQVQLSQILLTVLILQIRKLGLTEAQLWQNLDSNLVILVPESILLAFKEIVTQKRREGNHFAKNFSSLDTNLRKFLLFYWHLLPTLHRMLFIHLFEFSVLQCFTTVVLSCSSNSSFDQILMWSVIEKFVCSLFRARPRPRPRDFSNLLYLIPGLSAQLSVEIPQSDLFLEQHS